MVKSGWLLKGIYVFASYAKNIGAMNLNFP